jgi:hypothetical protein
MRRRSNSYRGGRWSSLGLVALLAPLLLPIVALAQGALTGAPDLRRPPGVGPLAAPPPISSSQNTDILRHRDPAGKPCLLVQGMARPHTINPNLFDHVIVAANGCAQLIKMQVCYYRTRQCIPMEVPGKGRREAVLGMMPSMRDFRYEFRERF